MTKILLHLRRSGISFLRGASRLVDFDPSLPIHYVTFFEPDNKGVYNAILQDWMTLNEDMKTAIAGFEQTEDCQYQDRAP